MTNPNHYQAPSVETDDSDTAATPDTDSEDSTSTEVDSEAATFADLNSENPQPDAFQPRAPLTEGQQLSRHLITLKRMLRDLQEDIDTAMGSYKVSPISTYHALSRANMALLRAGFEYDGIYALVQQHAQPVVNAMPSQPLTFKRRPVPPRASSPEYVSDITQGLAAMNPQFQETDPTPGLITHGFPGTTVPGPGPTNPGNP